VAEDSSNRQRRQFALEARDAPPHPVFDSFRPWVGDVEAGWDVNFLGVRTRVAFFSLYEELADFSHRRQVQAGLPVPNEDYFEWISLLESVMEAEGSFVMVELGAGWGKWIVNAVAALRAYNALPYHIVGVESEPTHFKWMKEHLEDNHVDLRNTTLIEAAVAREDGRVWFHVGAPADWYGQSITTPPADGRNRVHRAAHSVLWRQRATGSERTVQQRRAVSLASVLENLARVDLIDVDIQGAEADALEPAAEALASKVKRVYIATHDRDNEERLRTLFAALRWTSVYDYPAAEVSETPWGRVVFEDGAQVWINPRR
jgi:FkbM family methyltransferase